MCVCVRERERESVCVCVFMCVWIIRWYPWLLRSGLTCGNVRCVYVCVSVSECVCLGGWGGGESVRVCVCVWFIRWYPWLLHLGSGMIATCGNVHCERERERHRERERERERERVCVCVCVIYQLIFLDPPFGVVNDSDVWNVCCV